MNRFRVLHVTEFNYDGPVSESYNQVHLRPRDDARQICLSFRLRTDPVAQPAAHRDYFGNWVHHFNILHKHERLRIEAESVVMVSDPSPLFSDSLSLAELDGRRSELMEEFYEYLVPTAYAPNTTQLVELVRGAEEKGGGTATGFALAVTALIYERFRYEKGATQVHSSVEDVLREGAGVCQDFAHLLLALARMRGLPGRYVSGYLAPSSPGKKESDMEEVRGGLSSHAWAEIFIAGAGWLGLDPTLGQPVSQQHIHLAYGRDYGDVAPVRGVYRGHAGQRLSVDVRVRPALDDEGCEHLQETCATPAPPPRPEEPPQEQ